MTSVTDENGNIIGYERRYHNEAGELSRLDRYDENKDYLSFALYEYDEGRLYTQTEYGADGIAKSRNVYTYDDDGNLYESAYELPNGEATVARYDSDGNVIEKRYYDTDEKLTRSEILEDGTWKAYDPDGNPIE